MMTAMLVLAAHPIQMLLVAVTLRYAFGGLAEYGWSRRTVRNQAEIVSIAA